MKDTVDDLMRETKGRHVVQFSVDKGAAGLCEVMTSEFPHLQCRAVTGTDIRVESTEPIRVGPLVRFLEERGAEVAEARKLRPSLEDVFVDITGIKAGEMKQEREKARMGGGA